MPVPLVFVLAALQASPADGGLVIGGAAPARACYRHAARAESGEAAVAACDEAIRYYTEERTVPRRRHASYVNRGVIHYHGGRWGAAVDDFTYVIEHGRASARVLVNRGLAYEQLGRRGPDGRAYDALAEADYRRALTVRGEDALARRRLEQLAKPPLERAPLKGRVVAGLPIDGAPLSDGAGGD